MSKSINQELILEKISEMVDYCEKDRSVNGLTVLSQVIDVITNCPGDKLDSKWISVKKEMPKEHDSIFAKWKNTNKWLNGMFEKVSDNVNVTVKFSDGTKKTYTTFTKDGKWANLPKFGNPIVIHWMPLPEPSAED